MNTPRSLRLANLMVSTGDGDILMLGMNYRLRVVGDTWSIYAVQGNRLVRSGMLRALHLGIKALVSYEMSGDTGEVKS